MQLTFLMLIIPLCRSIFLPNIIFLLPKILPLMFFVVCLLMVYYWILSTFCMFGKKMPLLLEDISVVLSFSTLEYYG